MLLPNTVRFSFHVTVFGFICIPCDDELQFDSDSIYFSSWYLYRRIIHLQFQAYVYIYIYIYICMYVCMNVAIYLFIGILEQH
jgi:hypothetical protein